MLPAAVTRPITQIEKEEPHDARHQLSAPRSLLDDPDLFGFVVWIWLLFIMFADLFRRDDIGGWTKTAWIIFVVIFPFLGVFVYVIAQHKGLQERSARQQESAERELDQYVRSVAATSDPTQQIAKGEELLKSGAITQAEFDQDQGTGAGGLGAGARATRRRCSTPLRRRRRSRPKRRR